MTDRAAIKTRAPRPLRLTKHQADAVRAVISEINQLDGALGQKHREFKRITDMIQLDAGLDPEACGISGVEDIKGEPHLKFVAKPAPQK